MKYKIYSEMVDKIPYEERKEGSKEVCWRYSKNPIVKRNPIDGIARIFNSAVVPYNGEFYGVFRAEDRRTLPELRVGHSKDGINFVFDDHRIDLKDEEGNSWNPYYSYDPRVTKIGDEYFVCWCTDFYGPALALAKTKDFKNFTRLENASLPFNRNGVLFPRKFNGEYKLLSRISDNGHTPFGDIFVSSSKDLKYWGCHRHVMERGGEGWWESLKIGSGAVPIETEEGWLLLYHGVCNTCNGYVYSFGVAILDRDEPSKVLYRSREYLMTPEEEYETVGFVPNVCFPCATLVDKEGRIAIYYGSADTYVSLCFSTVDELIDFAKSHNEVVGRDRDLGK